MPVARLCCRDSVLASWSAVWISQTYPKAGLGYPHPEPDDYQADATGLVTVPSLPVSACPTLHHEHGIAPWGPVSSASLANSGETG